ncbi:response regulator transcription factor [Streptomyces sp. RKAG293]|uniref:response regulator transcription factor n=1 Tax=Streptomyces sp. RKAG293 TaxID=2893403 RepID=UPI002034A033|nr:response regulator transcription factor [Streptomyces sp. RKAG293]MCM2422633.1 response regulator transcription factor [Streptomyces sp. RKAG293]
MCAYVLVAEDDIKQAGIIGQYLEHEGHVPRLVHDGQAALDEVRRRPPDLLVLDLMMPVIDGLDVCRILRRESGLPVLMLTARSAEDDLLLALGLGADDYLTKPYSPRELMARIRSLLRRAEHSSHTTESPVLRAGRIAVDPLRRTVLVDGRRVDECTAAEFEVLAAMAAQPDRVFTRNQLLAVTRGTHRYITERTIDVHVLNLRKKIERDPRNPVHLLTVYGVGYKLSDSTWEDDPGTASGRREADGHAR